MGKSPRKPEDTKPAETGKNRGSDQELSSRLGDLGSRIEARQSARQKAEEDSNSRKSAGVAQALRMSSEFIAGVVVGAGFGYLVDTLAGTSPWGMILFLFLGFAAGVLNVMRSAGIVAESNLHLDADVKKGRDK